MDSRVGASCDVVQYTKVSEEEKQRPGQVPTREDANDPTNYKAPFYCS